MQRVLKISLADFAILFLCISFAFAQDSPTEPSAESREQRPRQPRIVSPEIASDRQVTFRVRAPQATQVSLSGEMIRGQQDFQKGENGVWTVTVGPIDPEIYHYNFTIDGVRTIDPANPNIKTGSNASTTASVLEIRGDSPAFYDPQPVPHGEICTHWYRSKSIGSDRRLTAYVPPGYDDNRDARYPVLYLFHGANADETAWFRLGRANLILDNLIAAGKIKPFIVVMPFGYGVPPGESGGQGKNTELFTRDLLEDVIPFVESKYRALADRDNRAIVGLSMGGGQALRIGLNNLDRFSYVGGFSSGTGRAAEFPKMYESLTADPASANERLHLVWIGCGTEDGQFNQSKAMSDFLNEHKIKHTFAPSPGRHTWMYWRQCLHEVAPLLFTSTH